MEYRKLPELRNLYPSDEENISKSFTSDDSTITYTGIYPENFITFDIVNLNGINGSDINVSDILPSTFKFIVQFIDGESVEQWTSQKLKDELLAAIAEPNPYFNKLTVTTAVVDLTKLKKYWRSKKFDIPERYAEVRITDTLTIVPDFLEHLKWVVDKNVAPDDLREVETFGAWSLYTGKNGLGFKFSQDIDDLDNGKIEGDDIIEKNAEYQYRPFNEVGTEIGEVRVHDGNTYVWSGVGWVLR